jgi:hypothetical protein
VSINDRAFIVSGRGSPAAAERKTQPGSLDEPGSAPDGPSSVSAHASLISHGSGYLQDVWAEAVDVAADPKAAGRERALVDRLVTEYSQASEEWSAIYRILGQGSDGPVRDALAAPAAASAVGIAYRGWSSARRKFRERPAAPLVDLENESSPNPIRRVAVKLERRL